MTTDYMGLLRMAAVSILVVLSVARMPVADRQEATSDSFQAQGEQHGARPNDAKSEWSVPLWNLQKIVAMLAGALAIYLGYRLFLAGVTGKASLSLRTTAVSGQLLNASPGLFFAVGGMALVATAILSK